MTTGRAGRVVVVAVALLLALSGAELLVRLLALDQRIITPLLFFQGADVPVHRVSGDPALRYELAPNAHYDGQFSGRTYTVNIDEHGARQPSHPALKGPGVFRIQCAGASTTYGATVDDDQTIPARLERRLNGTAPIGTRYEVWNFGTSGYTGGQAARQARMRVDSVRPDLVLVQLARTGARAYLMPPSDNALDYPWPEIVSDPQVWEEQFQFQLPALTTPLMRHSAFARALLAALPEMAAPPPCALCAAMDRDEARALSDAAEARGVPVVFYSIPTWRGAPSPDGVFPGLPKERFIDLFQPNREPEYYDIHPPPATLDELARLLATALGERGLLGKARPATDG